jgi:hypothetical protein
LAKYLGEGTSRREAEEKSSAFFISARVVLDLAETCRPANPEIPGTK